MGNPDCEVPGSSGDSGKGSQRLSVAELQAWEALRYGMFIHFGMSTFDGEMSKGDQPSTLYSPDRLDVDQWVSLARDAGMKYAVLTAKHVSGHCLWPTAHNDYHVGTSGNKTDVVEAFVKACERRGVLPGLYYCSWDNHNRFGSITPGDPAEIRASYGGDRWAHPSYTTAAYHDFQMAQLEELFTRYGPLAEVWIDIPAVLPRPFRERQYAQIARWQPRAVIMSNGGVGDGSYYANYTWPADLISMECCLPHNNQHIQCEHQPWRKIEGRTYYIPGEVCEITGGGWFYTEGAQPRSDARLLGLYLSSISLGTNLLLNVGPDKHGLIPQRFADALLRLRGNLDKLGM